jgi:hypothetical protein
MVDMEMNMNSTASAVVAFALFIGTISYVSSHDLSGVAAILMVVGAILLSYAVLATSSD